MAVIARNRSGQPQQVELGMLDAMISLLSLRLQQVLAVGHDLSRMGSGHPQACPWDVFHAADGPFVIAATRDEYWQRLCRAIGIPEYATREGYATIVERVANRPKVNALLNNLFKQQPRAHWLKALDGADVPNGPLNSLTEAMADETVRESGVMLEVDHPAPAGGRAGDHRDAEELDEAGVRARFSRPEAAVARRAAVRAPRRSILVAVERRGGHSGEGDLSACDAPDARRNKHGQRGAEVPLPSSEAAEDRKRPTRAPRFGRHRRGRRGARTCTRRGV
jgi:crotonobetainyl-CoA:carnitine CoA-transferase CaiB-like acyl-CoA transferase